MSQKAELTCPKCGGALQEQRSIYERYGIPYIWRGHTFPFAALFAGKELCDYVYQLPTWEQAKKQSENG